MLCIATTIHDPAALTFTCRRLGAPAERDCGTGFTWRIRLSGLCTPITINTLTGIITYDRRDNGFIRYAQLMRFVYRVYAMQAQRRLTRSPHATDLPGDDIHATGGRQTLVRFLLPHSRTTCKRRRSPHSVVAKGH